MKTLRLIILFLVICNIGGIVLMGLGNAVLGSLLSYATYLLMIVYYVISKKGTPAWPFIIFAITYYMLAGLQYVPNEGFLLGIL